MTDIQSILTRLAQNRSGQQLATHDGVTYFRSLLRSSRGGTTYTVADFANGIRVALESPTANERRFVMPNQCYFVYAFPFTEPPIVDISTLERQLAAAEFVAQGHALTPR